MSLHKLEGTQSLPTRFCGPSQPVPSQILTQTFRQIDKTKDNRGKDVAVCSRNTYTRLSHRTEVQIDIAEDGGGGTHRDMDGYTGSAYAVSARKPQWEVAIYIHIHKCMMKFSSNEHSTHNHIRTVY